LCLCWQTFAPSGLPVPKCYGYKRDWRQNHRVTDTSNTCYNTNAEQGAEFNTGQMSRVECFKCFGTTILSISCAVLDPCVRCATNAVCQLSHSRRTWWRFRHALPRQPFSLLQVRLFRRVYWSSLRDEAHLRWFGMPERGCLHSRQVPVILALAV